MSLNCCSLRKKTAQLKVLIEENQLDLIVLQETWLKRYDKSIYGELRELGFIIKSLERTDKKGGGLAILIKRAILLDKRVSSTYFRYPEFDNTISNFKIGKNLLSIVNMYRPPAESKSNFLKSFDDFLFKLLEQGSNPIILGDFNIDMIKKRQHNAKIYRNNL